MLAKLWHALNNQSLVAKLGLIVALLVALIALGTWLFPIKYEKRCRDKSHGVEYYRDIHQESLTSEEKDSGYTQPQWCSEVLSVLRGRFPGGVFRQTDSIETERNSCPPFICPKRRYICEFEVKADPIYKEAVSSACQ